MTTNWAVIPVKGLSESKTRLSNFLGDNRRALVEALLQDVLASVVRSGAFGSVSVISPDEELRSLVIQSHASFIKQTGSGLNAAIQQAYRAAARERVSSLTTVLADLPLVRHDDFREIVRLGAGNPRVVIAPSRKGGTNVMLTLPPGVVHPSYGRWSYSKHLRQAQRMEVNTYSISNCRLSLDIDTVEDILELKRRDPEQRSASGKVVRHLTNLPRLLDAHAAC